MNDSLSKTIDAIDAAASEAQDLYNAVSGLQEMYAPSGLSGIDISDRAIELAARKADAAVKDVLTLLRLKQAVANAHTTMSIAEEARRKLQDLADARNAR